jgi:hypothetical protein
MFVTHSSAIRVFHLWNPFRTPIRVFLTIKLGLPNWQLDLIRTSTDVTEGSNVTSSEYQARPLQISWHAGVDVPGQDTLFVDYCPHGCRR